MRPEVLADAIAKDRAAGWTPIAVVATLGTTSTTSVDPLAPVADVAERERLWLHVDAAYAGVVALIPERRDAFAGWERADSIVVNPHKWLFTPLDCSLLLTRRPEQLRAAFSVVPAYLKDLGDRPVHDYHEYTPQLGRRFRALKMWFLMRYFGVDGLRARVEEHIEMAQEFAAWVDAERDAERMAPAPFSTVCFRWRPERYAGRDQEPEVATLLDELNAALLARLNGTGEVFLSSTRLGERLVLRLAIGNIRTERRHVAQAWRLIRELGAEIAAGRPSVDAGGDAR
jgi:aromatic-L-amino-acid decarboxylase